SPIFDPGAFEAVDAAPREVAFLWKALKLKRGSRVLDIPCGTGRHSVLLARRGALVLGLDAGAEYLRKARAAARGLPNARFVQGDMRRVRLAGEFDAAINLWTSFGYFDDPADDLKVLRGVARALKPGGLFLIDLADYAAIRRRRAKNWVDREDGSLVLEEAFFTGGRDPKVVNEWIVLRPGRRAARSRFVVRGYDQRRLYGVLRRAGLVPLKSWGSPTGAPRRKGSTRLVVLARRA
ncbi:MAG: class I SAM-dependent methyltransferase, partial [Elusimicrobiota bacterium]